MKEKTPVTSSFGGGAEGGCCRGIGHIRYVRANWSRECRGWYGHQQRAEKGGGRPPRAVGERAAEMNEEKEVSEEECYRVMETVELLTRAGENGPHEVEGRLESKNGMVRTSILLDTGASRSFISRRAVEAGVCVFERMGVRVRIRGFAEGLERVGAEEVVCRAKLGEVVKKVEAVVVDGAEDDFIMGLKEMTEEGGPTVVADEIMVRGGKVEYWREW